MIFLDSSVLIDYFNGKKNSKVDLLDYYLGNELIVIGDYVLAEVLQGFKSENECKIAKERLLSFPCFNIGGKEIALRCADNYRYLRKKGITIRKTIDGMIAAFCIEDNFTLLHNDKDFEPFEKFLNLKVPHK